MSLAGEPPPHEADSRRRLLLAGRAIEFRFRRRRRRTIGLSVDAQGLAVAAPFGTPWHEVEGFMQSRARWIFDKLAQWAALVARTPFHGRSGESFPLHGADVTLQVRAGRQGVMLNDGALVVRLRDPARTAIVRSLLVRWLKADALRALAPRAAHYAARIGLGAPRLTASSARTQWGACTATGRIRLSFRLAHLEPGLADYVVAHEVAHLVELNHSTRFWRLVETLYPDWRTARQRIRLAAATLPLL